MNMMCCVVVWFFACSNTAANHWEATYYKACVDCEEWIIHEDVSLTTRSGLNELSQNATFSSA